MERRGRREDEAEFAAFVNSRAQHLLRVAYVLTRDAFLAEDLLQTALARCWPKWPTIKADPEPYIRAVLVNTYATWWRRRWRGEEPHTHLPELAVVADPLSVIDDRLLVWQALGGLTPRQRSVLVLRYLEDLTEAQTAQVLGLSTGTVKSATSRALALLRAASQKGVHDGA